MDTRICIKCHEEKNIELFPFKNKEKKYRMRSCKVCVQKMKNNWRINGPLPKIEKTQKICSKCKIEKNINDFPFRNKEKGYKMPYCRPCSSKRNKSELLKFIGPIAKNKKCNKCFEIKIAKDNFNWDISRNNYHSVCKKCLSQKQKQNRPAINEKRRLHRIQNPSARIRDNIQTRFSILKTGYKSKTFEKMVGCSLDFFISWLEFQFYDGMNLENYGKIWHIDHCIPCNNFDFTKEEEIKKCCSWKNLRPLKREKNMKKSGKIIHHDILMQELKTKVFLRSLNINPGII